MVAHEVGTKLARSHHDVRRLAAAAVTAPTLADAEPALRELAVVLPRHLADEEGPDGLLAALRRGGASARVLDRLVREHAAFRELLPNLVADVRRRDPAARARLERFLQRLLQHEWIETAALAKVTAARGGPRRCSADVDWIVTEVLGHARARSAWPSVVEVGVPGDADLGAEVAAAVEIGLGDAGLDWVVVVARDDAELRLLAVRFEEPGL